jgi:SAM-dependent methyltransferase
MFGSEYAAHPRWSKLERSYIRHFGVVDLPGRLRARTIFRELGELRGHTFLDIGSGTGSYSFYLSRQGHNNTWALDVDVERVLDCNRIAALLCRENSHFCVGSGDVGLNAFETASFDVALAVEVLQYLPDITLALAETHRVLKPGGCLIGHVPVLGYLRDAEQNLFDNSNLPNMLVGAGFEIVSFVPTFGGNIRRLCRVFARVNRWRILTAVVFPTLLLLSSFCRVESPDGDYRLFVARKPVRQDSGLSALGCQGKRSTVP